MRSKIKSISQSLRLPPNFKKIVSFILGIPLTILSLLFIANFIYTNTNEILPQLSRFDPLGVIVGFLFITIFFVIRSFAWNDILRVKGYNLPLLDSAFLLATAELKRYIPGSILAVAARVNNLNRHKIPGKSVLKMILVESIIFAASSMVISLPGAAYLLAQNNIGWEIYFLIGTLLVTSVFLFIKFKQSTVFEKITKYSNSFCMMCAAWVFFGVGNFLVISSFSYFDPRTIVAISSLAVLAWLVGYLVVIAPLGLGVREAFFTYALTFTTPVGIAATLSIVSRLAFTFAELVFILAVVALKKSIKKVPVIDLSKFILFSAIFSYIFYFTYVSFQKYLNFFTGRFDLGNMDQTVWNTMNGNIFQLTNPDGVNTVSRLAFHSDFILILLAPFYFIWTDARMLLAIQVVVVAFGAYFVFLIAQSVFKDKLLPLVFSLSYLLNPFVQKQTLFDFHSVTLATTFLLGASYFIQTKRYSWMMVMLVLAAITKEEVFAIIALVLLYVSLKTKNVWYALLSIISFTLFYLLISKFIPDARGGEHFATEYFQDFGNTPREIIINLVLDPVKTFSTLLTASNLEYMFKILLPTGFTSIAAPLYMIFSLPDLLINLISKNENLRSLTFHYAATIIPFIYASSIFGVAKILSLKLKFLNSRSLGMFVFSSALISTYMYGTLPGAKHPSVEVFNRKTENAAQIRSFIAGIPPSLSVSASNNLGSQLSQRVDIYTIPIGVEEADVIALLLNDDYAAPSPSFQRQLAHRLTNDENYVLVYRISDFIVFAKIREAGKILPAKSF